MTTICPEYCKDHEILRSGTMVTTPRTKQTRENETAARSVTAKRRFFSGCPKAESQALNLAGTGLRRGDWPWLLIEKRVGSSRGLLFRSDAVCSMVAIYVFATGIDEAVEVGQSLL
jgi:hypothetical protein